MHTMAYDTIRKDLSKVLNVFRIDSANIIAQVKILESLTYYRIFHIEKQSLSQDHGVEAHFLGELQYVKH